MAGLETSALDDEAFNVEAAMDRCILRLIANCCNGKNRKIKQDLHCKLYLTDNPHFFIAIEGDKLVRATELARALSLEKSVRGAIKLVTALKLPILAERFNGILEVKFRLL